MDGRPADGRGAFHLSDEQRIAWLRLSRSEGIGPVTFRRLINRFGGADAALSALATARDTGGPPARLVERREAEAEIAALDRMGGSLLAWGEAGYPEALRAADGAPPLLSVLGDAAVLTRPCVAVVGARNASALGQRFAAELAGGLGEAGFVVVSGLARGIDGAAHEAALRTGTVGVLAGGLSRIYPSEHEALAARMRERGALVSEMPLRWTATARDFPRRNRIISGLSLGIVVVEAALRSGSLITARLAGEQGREVFAVPGFPLDPRAEGTNRLIRDGATLVTAARDVVEALMPLVEAGAPVNRPLSLLDASGGGVAAEADASIWDRWLDALPGDDPAPANVAVHDVAPDSHLTDDTEPGARDELVALIGAAPVSVDELVRRSGLPLAAVQAAILDLDLAGRIERHGQNRISLL